MSSTESKPTDMGFLERFHADAEKRGYREPIPDHQTLLRILMDQDPIPRPDPHPWKNSSGVCRCERR